MQPFAIMKGAGLAAALPNGPFTDTNFDPADALITFTFLANGTWSVVTNSGVDDNSGVWKTGGGTSADYRLRVDPTVGTFSTGSTGVDNTFPQTYTVTRTSVGVKACEADYTIKTVAGASLVSKNIDLTATVSL